MRLSCVKEVQDRHPRDARAADWKRGKKKKKIGEARRQVEGSSSVETKEGNGVHVETRDRW